MRDQRRKKEFIEKKKETALLKEKSEKKTAALITPVGEINLETNDKAKGIFKVKGTNRGVNQRKQTMKMTHNFVLGFEREKEG